MLNWKRWEWAASIVLLALALPWATPATAQVLSPEGVLAQAGAALDRGDLDAAEQGFRQALEQLPDHPLSWLGLSEVLMARGQLVEALAAARQARLLAPELGRAALAEGSIHARLGATEPAIEALGDAIRLAPEHIPSYLVLALLLRDSDRYPEAIELLTKAPQSPLIKEQLAFLLLGEGRKEEALAAANAGLELAESKEEEEVDLAQIRLLRYARAMALAVLGDQPEEARRALTEVIQPGPGQVPVQQVGLAHLELATLESQQGRSAQAEVHFELAADLLPNSSEVPFRLAGHRRSQGDLEGAQEALTSYQEIEQRLSDMEQAGERYREELRDVLAKAQDHAQKNELEQALAVLDGWSGDPDARILILRAKVVFSLNRAEEAIRDLTQARTLDPANPEAPYLEGMMLRSVGKPAEAEVAIRRSLVLAPTLGQARYLLAVVLADLGRLEESVVEYERALAIGVDTPSLRQGLEAVKKKLAEQ